MIKITIMLNLNVYNAMNNPAWSALSQVIVPSVWIRKYQSQGNAILVNLVIIKLIKNA